MISNNDTLYMKALETIDADKFEKLCEVLLSFKFPEYNVKRPTRNPAGQDGGEDAFSDIEKIKYAFSIQQNWQNKVQDEIDKCITHNTTQPDTNRREKIIYITNQKIIETEWKKFCATKKALLDMNSLALEKYDNEVLIDYIEEYFRETCDPKLFYKLGLSALLCHDRCKLPNNTWGLSKENSSVLEEEYYKKEMRKEEMRKEENPSNVGKDNNTINTITNIENNTTDYPLYTMLKEHCNTIKISDDKNFKNFIIYAEGGVGKSFEMQITVLKLRKDAERKKDTIQAYYYDLRNYIPNTFLKQQPSNLSEPFYIFLDGYDELSTEDRHLLKKEIEQTRSNKHSVFFVITTRKDTFEY